VRHATLLLLAALPSPAAAHDAFGDLGPFYQAMLHPLADPAQGLLLAATAVFLARLPLSTVRRAFAVLAAAGGITLVVALSVTLPEPSLRAMTLAALVMAVIAILPWRPGQLASSFFAAALGVVAALPVAVGGGGPDLLVLFGGAAGIALGTLFLWGLAETADRRLSPLSSTVGAAWIGAIAIMTAAIHA
jgi:urease accessory protein